MIRYPLYVLINYPDAVQQGINKKTKVLTISGKEEWAYQMWEKMVRLI